MDLPFHAGWIAICVPKDEAIRSRTIKGTMDVRRCGSALSTALVTTGLMDRGGPAPCRVALRDHCFELPTQSLEASSAISPSATAGTVQHTLVAGPRSQLDSYDYPETTPITLTESRQRVGPVRTASADL